MNADHEKCLRAGASDYVAKPVDLDLLFSVMRVWMARDVDNRFEHGITSMPTWLVDPEPALDDDRDLIQAEDSVLLIVEDDPTFAQILMDRAGEGGFKTLVALRGSTAITLARNFKPKAITLDVRLPDMSGWTVLDNLKHDPATRHIPVHVLSGSDTARDGFTLGAMTCAEKASAEDVLAAVFERVRQSVEPGAKKLLVVRPSVDQRLRSGSGVHLERSRRTREAT